MNAMVTTLPTQHQVHGSLEAVLQELSRYGAPMLLQVSDGAWLCKVDMRVNATGATFEVKARAAAPLISARECVDNMKAAIATIHLAAGSKP